MPLLNVITFSSVCVCVCCDDRTYTQSKLCACVFSTLSDRVSIIPSDILYVVTNPVRCLLDRKISQETSLKLEHPIVKQDKRRKKGGKKQPQ